MAWETLDEFTRTMAQWAEVQRYLESIGAQRRPGTRLVAFSQPKLDGSTLILPNGPARDQMDDAEIQLTVTKDDDGYYSLRQTGYERSETFTDRQEWRCSRFDLMGKYILVKKNSSFRFKIGAPSIFHRWLEIGLAPQWTKQHLSREQAGVDWMYKYANTSSPDTFYYDYENGDPLTFPFSMSYQEITGIYMEGIPLPN